MRRQVLVTGIVEQRSEAVAPDRLERIAWSAALVTIVDKQRHSPVLRQLPCNGRNRSLARRRSFDNLPIAVERKASSRGNNTAFRTVDILANGQGIQKLVGDEQHGPCWKFLS